MTNGFNGTELMTATAVNANGTVTGDNHVSQTSGWASLSFTPVNATGLRIGFSNATPISVNHYRVYELQLYGSGSGGGTGNQPAIAVGQSVNGVLTTSSARSDGCPNCYADTYRLTVAAAQRIEVRLNSTAFDAFLQIFDGSGNFLADDDDGGGGSNSRIAGTFAAGTYLIEVTTAAEKSTGAYTLSLTALP